MPCRRCYVSGRVQGVFFRASTCEKAQSLGVSGYVRNLPDGRVEVLVCGTGIAVQRLCDWLKQGPQAAQVSEVSCSPDDETPPDTFLSY